MKLLFGILFLISTYVKSQEIIRGERLLSISLLSAQSTSNVCSGGLGVACSNCTTRAVRFN